MAFLTLEDKLYRHSELRRKMHEQELDVLVLTGDANIKYVAGEFHIQRWANVVFFRDENIEPVSFIAHIGREYLLDIQYKNMKYYWVSETRLNGPDAISSLIKEKIGSEVKIGITFRDTGLGTYFDLRDNFGEQSIKSFDGAIEDLRHINHGNALKALRLSPQTVDLCCENLKNVCIPGALPVEICADWEYKMRAAGAPDNLNQIVVDKKDISSVLPAWTCEQKPLEKGDQITCEITSGAGGYYTQKIQHVSLGQPPQAITDLHNAVDEAVWAAADAIGPGVLGRDILRIIDEKIASKGFLYASQFNGGPVIHGSGLNVDEYTFTPDADYRFDEGFMFVIHPSAAVQGWTRGDYAVFGPGTMFLVNSTGVECLNKYPNDIVVVDC